VPAPELSIIIPAYNEEQRISTTLRSVCDYLDASAISAELIVVDDGSTDETVSVVENNRPPNYELRLLSNGDNRGKGFSVRRGMLAAVGEIALFTDADLSAPIVEAEKLLWRIRNNECDCAIGSRAVDRSLIDVHQSRFREWAGMTFNFVVRCLLGMRFADTQCGFKAFRRKEALIVFKQQRIDGFGFDPEILYVALRHGLRIMEVPVRWSHHPATKVNVFTDSIRMFLALLTIRRNAAAGRYACPSKEKLALGIK
jgi:dolichyl-phosphate beta-glucosyltransferase